MRMAIQRRFFDVFMRITLESFRNVIRQSALVDDDILDRRSKEFDALVAKEAQASGEAAKGDAKRFAQFLMEQKEISRWQAENLLKGKHKGFRLGKYKLISLLGKGGMSSVYLAEHTVMKRRVAIKVLPHKKVNDASYLGRFHREAQAVASLDHPNIVRAYDVDAETDGSMEIHFLVMEYVEGMSLQELIAKKGTLDPKEAADFIRQAAEGLEHAHAAGLVHRDIKPGNLLVDKSGVVKLLDLGLARFFNDEENSLTVEHDEKVLGTADYLAPEQAVDSHTVDHRADLYALGCTLYFLLSGEPPFNEGSLAQRLIAHQTKEPKPLTAHRDDIPESLVALVTRLMAKKPEDRPATAAEAAELFASWLSQEGQGGTSEPDSSLHGTVAEESTPTGDDALGSFLDQLDSTPSLKSGVEVSSNSRVGPMGDSGLAATPTSGPTSGASSNIHGRGPSSVLAKRKQGISTSYLVGGGLALAVVAGIVWALFGTDGSATQQGVVTQSSTVNSGPSGGIGTAPTTVERPPIKGNVITVGQNGNFGTLEEAVAHVVATFTPFDSTDTRTIELAAGEVFEETLTVDSSGLDQFPRYVTITTDASNPATLKGDGIGVTVSLKSVNNLTISHLRIDAAGASTAVTIEGYAGGTKIQDAFVTGFSGTGIDFTGVAGVGSERLKLERVTVRTEEGRSPSAGVKLVSAIPETARIEIQACRLQGPMDSGVEVVGPSRDVWIRRTVFEQLDRGVSFPSTAADFETVHLIGNTFHNVKTGIAFAQQPAPSSKKLAVAQNLFTNVDRELIVAKGFKRAPMDQLFKNGGWFSENFSTRPKPEKRDPNEYPVVNDAGFSVQDAKYSSTDRSAAGYLQPKAAPLAKAKGGPDPKFIGAIQPTQ